MSTLIFRPEDRAICAVSLDGEETPVLYVEDSRLIDACLALPRLRKFMEAYIKASDDAHQKWPILAGSADPLYDEAKDLLSRMKS